MNDGIYVSGIISIDDKEFESIRTLVYDKFGINLTEKKKSLVCGRLNKLIKALGLKSFGEYYEYVINDLTNLSLVSLIDRISTNHTFFYREKDHFEFLKNKVLPEIISKLIKENIGEMRIWCAGCATGEEAYTLAFILNDFIAQNMLPVKPMILATDISTTALEKAAAGIYPAERLKELPKEYFNNFNKSGGDYYAVAENVKKNILFKRFNFMNDYFPFKGKFDIIFCRNVMIYFDKPTRENLVNKFYEFTKDDGYFFVGHSESLDRKATEYTYIQPAVYKKQVLNKRKPQDTL